jgi:hypothetical protein
MKVRMINLQTGIITTKLNSNSYWSYNALCCDLSGNLFVANNVNIYKITSNNVVSTYAGGGANNTYPENMALNSTASATSVKFHNIKSLTINNNNGDLYVMDFYGRSHSTYISMPYDIISKVTTNGIISLFAGTVGPDVSPLSNNNTYYFQNMGKRADSSCCFTQTKKINIRCIAH